MLCSEMVKICTLVKVSYLRVFEWDFYCFQKQNCLIIFGQKSKIPAIVGEGEKGSRNQFETQLHKEFHQKRFFFTFRSMQKESNYRLKFKLCA